MRNMKPWIVSGMLAAAAWSFAAQSPASRSGSFEDYKLIYERNIFSRQRYTPASRSGAPGETRMEKVVLSLYVLRGVAVETGSRLAFVEDAISGQSKRLAVGETLLSGTIAEIRPDRVVFREKDQTRDVLVGQEFDRVESMVERPVDAAGETSDPNKPQETPAAKSAAPAAPQDEAAMLKQMMERRKQEMGN